MKSALLATLLACLALSACGGDDDPQPPPTDSDGQTATTDGGSDHLPECYLEATNVLAFVALVGGGGASSIHTLEVASTGSGVEPLAEVYFFTLIKGEKYSRTKTSDSKGRFEGAVVVPTATGILPVTFTVKTVTCRSKSVEVVTPWNAQGHPHL